MVPSGEGPDRGEPERADVPERHHGAEQPGPVGADAVTTRRLAERTEYSQPVLHSHFRGKREIIGAVALEGATEMAAVPRAASAVEEHPRARVTALARADLDFAERNPAVHDAVFQLDGGPAFDAFAALLERLGAAATGGHRAQGAAAGDRLAVLSRSLRARPGGRVGGADHCADILLS
ncbi:TetR/AcrR family transcriptional regulator [Streptomyces vinaceus]|uniref:TetR/AcrR family transcriptional regulator n=1 Tax=Streptomyces vinaceus TaxID=1960 RepID=UPI0019874C1A|nr:hypothetical protein GCM10017778_48070 [Streptomyces vinaceus]